MKNKQPGNYSPSLPIVFWLVQVGPWPLKAGVLVPAAASPESLLGMQILGPRPRPNGLEPAFHKTTVGPKDKRCEAPRAQARALERMMAAIAIPGSLRYRLLLPHPRNRAQLAFPVNVHSAWFWEAHPLSCQVHSRHTGIKFSPSPGPGANSTSLNDPDWLSATCSLILRPESSFGKLHPWARMEGPQRECEIARLCGLYLPARLTVSPTVHETEQAPRKAGSQERRITQLPELSLPQPWALVTIQQASNLCGHLGRVVLRRQDELWNQTACPP